jgi:TLC domain
MMGSIAHFFLGCSEISSMLLVWLDLTRFFPPAGGTMMDQFTGNFAAPIFAVLFIYFRVVRWWPSSWRLYQDMQQYKSIVGKKDNSVYNATTTRPVHLSLALLLALTVPMGILQIYWLGLILQEGMKMLSPPAGAAA